MIHRHLISEIKSQKRSRKLYQRLVPADNKKTVKTPGGGEEKHLQKFCMSRYEALLLLSYLLSHFKPRSDWGKFAKILWSIIILYQNWSHSKGIESFHQDWCLMTIKNKNTRKESNYRRNHDVVQVFRILVSQYWCHKGLRYTNQMLIQLHQA